MEILKIITIPGQLISKKNNQEVHVFSGHGSIGHKKAWRLYEKEALEFLKSVEPFPESTKWPIYLHIYHYRKDKRQFDFLNLAQGICDVLQGDLKIKTKEYRHQIIPEDNTAHIIPVMESCFSGWEICKERPRTVLTFTDDVWEWHQDLNKQEVIQMLERYSENK